MKTEQDILNAADEYNDEIYEEGGYASDEELIEYVRERVPTAPLSLILEVLGIVDYVSDDILDRR